jgi:membrane protein
MGELRGVSAAVVRSAVRHRTTGHAAEMSFFAMLALVPATVTVGAAMHLLGRVAGERTELREQAGAVSSIRVVIGPGLGESIIVPFVRAQLTQQHGGVAIGGILVTWWLFSHLFHSTSHALDAVYEVDDRRRTPVRRAIALAYALASVVAVTVTLAVMSAAPLGINDEPHSSVVGNTLQGLWTVARWPLLVAVVVLTFLCLYRYSPDVRHSFRNCLPGALLAAALWIVLIICFRFYLALGFGAPTGVISDDPRIQLIGQAVAAVVATSFLFYFASSAVHIGAELNAELIRRTRGAAAVPDPGRAMVRRTAWPSAAALASLAERLPGRKSPNGQGSAVPAPSPGRRVRVISIPDEPASGPAADDGSQRVGLSR